ncbi:ATP-dependent RNA helicase [Clavulina sp. PMI_390]|nr:ATP-dependent RNA helicase [Clavulina sp. PMI_390]
MQAMMINCCDSHRQSTVCQQPPSRQFTLLPPMQGNNSDTLDRHHPQIRYPNASAKESLMNELGLNTLPSKQQIRDAIEKQWLSPKDTLPDHWLRRYQVWWNEPVQIPSLLSLAPGPPPTELAFVRTGLEGKVVGYVETSTSLLRDPAPASTFVRGKSGYLPFRPGGLDDVAILDDDNDNSNTINYGNDGTGTAHTATSRQGELLTIAPGLDRGLDFGTPIAQQNNDANDDDEASRAVLHPGKRLADHHDVVASSPADNEPTTEDIDDFLPTERLRIAASSSSKPKRRTQVTKRDWAHVVDVNKGIPNFHELVPEMAHKYPFELDNFQKEAVYHLEMGDSVFVAAHTSAGKTVVAEYAIALAAKHMTRAIYTSPIKALSNQKFRDFKQTFDPSTVGILTGDVQINPEGNCLIMTTEILRSMLYKGADLIRDVEFVIFDEVHYVNDAERGVVWEEVIIMLPEHVNIILLSATVPNTKEFADWVGRTKKKDIYVISTPKRPVPLEHFLYAGRELFKIVDAQGQFLGNGYKDAGEALKRKQDKERAAAGLPPVQRVGARGAAPARGGGGQRGGMARGAVAPRGSAPPRGGGYGSSGPRSFQQQDRNLYVHLVGHLKKLSLLPVVVFTFSKKKCEENAGTLSNTDLCDAGEKSEVHVMVEKALRVLKGSDKKLPQIQRMRDLLSRGIGVHHGGLLPIVKEVVELLFARGLVKVLFATETFAMGVNMPARSVVFANIRKHDGRSFRDLLPGEYTQMSGRAGRRGLDSTGVVIIVSGDELPETPTLHKMMLGPSTKLQSQFRLTYNMILNLLRVETLKVEEMIKRSFSENASQRLLPDQQKEVLEVEKSLRALPKLDMSAESEEIRSYYDLCLKIVRQQQSILKSAAAHQAGSKTLGGGRVVILRDGHFRGNLAVMLKQDSIIMADDGSHPYWILALVDEATKAGDKNVGLEEIAPRWPPPLQIVPDEEAVYEVAPISLRSVALVTNRTIKVDLREMLEIRRISALKNALSQLQELRREWSGPLPEVEWPKMKSLEFQEALKEHRNLVKKLDGFGCVLDEGFEDKYAVVHGEKILRQRIANLRLAISDENLELLPDYEQRVDVLKELKHIDEHSTVLLKGRVACEINSTNELVLTELILENTFAMYTPAEVAALLSAFVFQEKTEVEPALPPRLQEGRDAIVKIEDRVGRIQDAHKVVAAEWASSLKFGLMEVVWEWANGIPFEKITELTDVAEGTIVRVITRLDETCREVRDAARVIGDAELFKKMEEAQTLIKRDIVFAASLYF